MGDNNYEEVEEVFFDGEDTEYIPPVRAGNPVSVPAETVAEDEGVEIQFYFNQDSPTIPVASLTRNTKKDAMRVGKNSGDEKYELRQGENSADHIVDGDYTLQERASEIRERAEELEGRLN